jgi:hypothetical protein
VQPQAAGVVKRPTGTPPLRSITRREARFSGSVVTMTNARPSARTSASSNRSMRRMTAPPLP